MPGLYENLVRPAMFGLDAEKAHEMGIESLRVALGSSFAQQMASARFATSGFGEIERFGLRFANPLGIAAGFDKNGIVVNQLAALGFGFVEVGTVTFDPQKGNEKPRLFRLPDDRALINRLGFNNDGARVVRDRLQNLKRRCIVGVNIGKNKDVPNEAAVENYLATFDLVHEVADYIAVNISSPNTPNLRELQRAEIFEQLISALIERDKVLGPGLSGRTPEGWTQNRGGTQHTPILVKIAPDLSDQEIEEIVDICIRSDIDGIIATNTTISRDGVKSPNAADLGPGGLSGKPLTKRSTEVIARIYRHSQGKLPIVGVGGIFTPEDAFDKIVAGASLIQAYTGFIYGGPSFARTINTGLLRILKERGFTDLDEAVGSVNKN
jgi:dihydroorotate dehydrogenase